MRGRSEIIKLSHDIWMRLSHYHNLRHPIFWNKPIYGEIDQYPYHLPYTLRESNMASWEIPEVNGRFNWNIIELNQ